MKRVIIRNTLIILITLFLSYIVFFLYQEIIYKKVEQDPIVSEEKRLSLIMVGDSLIHGAVYADAVTNYGYDFKPMLEYIKPITSKYDLAFYNQESILGGSEIGVSTYPRFNSPYEVGDAFLDAGFNLVSLANNHTLDRGETAILNSLNYWKDKNVYTAGSYGSEDERNTIKVASINGISYALLSYTCWTNGLSVPNGKTYYLNRYDAETVKRDIDSIRDRVDLLMVSMHFGNEYSLTPSSEQKEIASYLAELGVDIIIGHHPHVVQPIDFIDDTLVIYSLGNFISAQRGVEKLTGLMVGVDIIKDDKTGNITLENTKAELIYTFTDTQKGYRGNFKVYPYTMLTDELLPNYKMYYNKYMNVVTHGDDRIEKSDIDGDI